MSTFVNGKIKQVAPRPNGGPNGEPWIPTLGEVLFMPVGEIRRLALGFLNLLCATALPDTLDLDIPACLNKLLQWAERVRRETDRNLHRFTSDPAKYQNSEAYFRAGMMITVLQLDLGVHYDPKSIQTQLFMRSSEGFIHGPLEGKGGTCANLPVLYAAIGRILHYPIYICCAKGHIFCRWASPDGRERFNIEGACEGMNCFTDDYYMRWPNRITPQEVHEGYYLRNLDAVEELGHFMTIRGHCLQDRGHYLDAIVAYAHAHRLAPAEPHHFACLMAMLRSELGEHHAGRAPNSYRHWEDLKKVVAPKQAHDVLRDDFPRIDKKRPAFRPVHSIRAPSKGANHGL